jgi:hypothetical protein
MKTVDISLIAVLSGVTITIGFTDVLIPIPTSLFICYILKMFKENIVSAIVLGKAIKLLFIVSLCVDIVFFAYLLLLVLDDMSVLYAIKRRNFNFNNSNLILFGLLGSMPSTVILCTSIVGSIIGSYLVALLLVAILLPVNMVFNAVISLMVFKTVLPKMDSISDKLSMFEEKTQFDGQFEEMTVSPLMFLSVNEGE